MRNLKGGYVHGGPGGGEKTSSRDEKRTLKSVLYDSYIQDGPVPEKKTRYIMGWGNHLYFLCPGTGFFLVKKNNYEIISISLKWGICFFFTVRNRFGVP